MPSNWLKCFILNFLKLAVFWLYKKVLEILKKLAIINKYK